ncbi:hypothetical protein JOF42_003336 [Microbacterium phyllosphaerae]|uniref:Uncharacterized protein n=1 Tax=Microbacterium phyllosphaerae TaxID=124798 RepID=A0ABS4WUU7_9MICO|nr:hypothetical protein [Microbacterium phyllosphaerae]
MTDMSIMAMSGIDIMFERIAPIIIESISYRLRRRPQPR